MARHSDVFVFQDVEFESLWGPFFTVQPLPRIIFMNIDPKVTPIRRLETQKRPNTEPQGVPEALETLIR